MAPDTKQAPPLRVAQIIESMAMGGAEHLAVKTANHLAAAGHESHLIVTRGPDVLSAKKSGSEVMSDPIHIRAKQNGSSEGVFKREIVLTAPLNPCFLKMPK